MNLAFETPWLVMAAAGLALAAVAVAWRARRAAPGLFTLAAAALMLGAGGPQLQRQGNQVRHVVVVDVSDSMVSRLAEARAGLKRELEQRGLPPGHSLGWYQLSDAVRPDGAPVGGPTRFGRLADAGADASGEILLVTDGRGSLAELLAAVAPGRVILLPAPPPEAPDGAVLALRAPSVLPRGSTGQLRVEVGCDRDVELAWRVFLADAEIARGTQRVVAGRHSGFGVLIPSAAAGVQRLRVRLELPGDREPRNDSAELTVLAGGARVIEYARDPAVPEPADALLALLRADPRNEVRVRHNLPADAAELEGAGLLVINDLPLWATGLSAGQLSGVARWVQAGGALLMAGATGAFAPGGYRGTVIEDLMPVRFRPDDEPPRHMLLLLDTSSSMAERTAGGSVKLELLRDAARRTAAALDPADRLAIAGFHTRLRAAPEFVAASNRQAHAAALAALRAEGRTYIRASLAQAVESMASLAVPARAQRILLVTDGEEGEPLDAAAWQALAARLHELNLALDIVLTEPGRPAWLEALERAPAGPGLQTVTVGDRGFDDLLLALERALAGQEQGLVVRGKLPVAGVAAALPAVVRTSARKSDRVHLLLQCSEPACPLLARRELVGRTGVVCAPTAGGTESAAFWSDPAVQAALADLLSFLMENAGQPRLALVPLAGGGAELVWTAAGDPPAGDLEVPGLGTVRRVGAGRWRLETLPAADRIEVFAGKLLLQSIALPRVPGPELAWTGNDEVFFRQAEQAGFRVFSGLGAWQPRRWDSAGAEALPLAWLAAAIAIGLLLGAIVLRRRA